MTFIRRRCGCMSARGYCCPARSEGNTRLYTDEDLERLEFILNLARDLGVNIAGIAIVLQMRERMEEMNRQMQGFVDYVRTEMLDADAAAAAGGGTGAGFAAGDGSAAGTGGGQGDAFAGRGGGRQERGEGGEDQARRRGRSELSRNCDSDIVAIPGTGTSICSRVMVG